MEKTKRALVRRWLDLSGGMAQNTENLPTHRSKMINPYAEDQKPALGALFPPVDLFVGEKAATVINLNNFDLLYLGINRYGDGGELVQEPAGVMLSSGLTDQEADSYAHAYVFPDNAYASLQITGVRYAIDRDSVQNRLCQTCLDSINDLWFTDQPLAEYAIISFEDRTIRPLLNSHPWFASGNFGIDCEFKDNGTVDLLVHYCPLRYE